MMAMAEESNIEYPPVFGKYDTNNIVIRDKGLERYITLKSVLSLHTNAIHANKAFMKHRVHIVERLINKMMRTEHTTGEKQKAYKIVREAFEIIEKKTKENPIQVLVRAIENASPKEDVVRLKFGGIPVHKAVDVSSSRRVDIALKNISKGAFTASRNSKKKLVMCLADEIILASRGDLNSFAVAKKEETERVAASAR